MRRFWHQLYLGQELTLVSVVLLSIGHVSGNQPYRMHQPKDEFLQAGRLLSAAEDGGMNEI